ncbi:MAG: hypothetical protein ABR499_08670 [Gemmatimonadaceae bacterium]
MSILPRCEQCGGEFDPLTGGICASCGRLLCGRHLRGWLRSLLPTIGTARPVCVDCRAGRRPASPRPGTAMHPTRLIAIAVAVLVTATGAACRTRPPERASDTRCGAGGLLIIRNHSGRVLEIYESGRGATEFIGFASPGVTRLPVRGPSDLAIVYRVREPSEGRDAATVTWLRPNAVARGSSRFMLELTCR